MNGNNSRNPFVLSYQVFRSGTEAFENATTHEIIKNLNKVGHCCLNVFASTALFITLMFLIDNEGSEKAPTYFAALYATAIWIQLAAIRYRHFIPLLLTVVVELITFALITHKTVAYFLYSTASVKDYVAIVLFLIATIVRCVYMFILYKVLIFKNPHFSLSSTVLLKPTNTPVTFFSVMAPQELDPTNPYYPQTVYNNNNNQFSNGLLGKS